MDEGMEGQMYNDLPGKEILESTRDDGLGDTILDVAYWRLGFR